MRPYTFELRAFLLSVQRAALPPSHRQLSSCSLCSVSASPAVSKNGNERRPAGYWKEKEHRKEFLMAVKKEEGGADWSTVSARTVVSKGGGSLLNVYGGSLRKALDDTFDTWDGREAKKSRQRWESQRERREEAERIREMLEIESPEKWNDVTCLDVRRVGGRSLLRFYGESLSAMLKDCLPEEADVYERLPRGYWQSLDRQREFLDGLAESEGLVSAKDWRRVTTEDVRKAGGGGLLAYYKGSLLTALQTVYGGEDDAWDPTECRPSVKSHYWAKAENVKRFLERLEGELHIEKPEEWLRVSVEQIRASGGWGMLDAMPLICALSLAYPNVQWKEEIEKVGSQAKKRACQRILRASVAAIFDAKTP